MQGRTPTGRARIPSLRVEREDGRAVGLLMRLGTSRRSLGEGWRWWASFRCLWISTKGRGRGTLCCDNNAGWCLLGCLRVQLHGIELNMRLREPPEEMMLSVLWIVRAFLPGD